MIVVVGALVAVSAILGRTALLTFDAFDMSAFMDAGWRVASGQRPYVDFYYTGGPIHLYLHAASYVLFGFGKVAVLAHLLAVNAVVLIAAYVIARRHLGVVPSLLLAVLSSIAFYGPIAHPWYDQNATMWLVVGVLLMEPAPSSRAAVIARGAALGVLVVLAFFTKSNVGVGGGAAFLGALLATRRRWDAVAGYAAGGVVAAIVVLGSVSAEDFVYQAFIAYRPQSRMLNTYLLRETLRQTPYLWLLGLTGAVASLGGRAFIVANLERLALLGGLLFTSVFSAWTGSMKVPANILLVGIEATLLAVLASRLPAGLAGTAERRIRRTAIGGVLACALVLLVSAGYKTADRLVWSWRSSNLDNAYAFTTPAMRGWRCNPRICEGIDRSVAWIQANVPPGDTLFVFPDATVIYGLTGHQSWKKAPFIFHAGQVPAPGPLYDAFRAHLTSAPPRWIVLHNQTEVGFFHTWGLLRWLELDAFVTSRYRPVWQWGDFTVARLIE